MSRYRGPRTKILRALGVDLPGFTTRSQERRPYPPGEHGHKRRKLSEYAVRVQETKKLRFNYGVSERYLRGLIAEARGSKFDTTLKIIELLELRLDNVVFRAGLAPTIPAARQMVCHGHVLVDDHRVDIASYRLRVGQQVRLKNVQRPLRDERFPSPTWLHIDREARSAKVGGLPDGKEVMFPLNVKLIIEHYSTRL
jgi:small subunit ribosomal protein S4